MQFIQFQSQDPNSLNTPSAGSFNIFVDQADNNLKVKNSDGEVYDGGGGNIEVTYSELVNTITTSGLTAGGFYLITNFRTCYDQPDFDNNFQPITTGATKQSAVEPIVVFATSESTISTNAYQPLYPNDRIQYDWTFSATEVTNSVAYGRITERIDEFNNRTDYDHRTILFKRYRLYTNREGLRLNGTIELFNNGIVGGTSTSFTALTVGDVINIPNASPSYYEVVSISGNTSMTVSGDTIGTVGAGSAFYLAVDENNGGGYFSYKRTNVKTNDFIEYTTFGDAIFNDYAKNNYIGNFANNYQNISSGVFILANNVFLEGQYESNKFGDYCYNNTFGTDNQNNIWGDYCYENVSVNDIDDNIIGHYFNRNLINTNLTSNHIGNYFYNNRLLNENGVDFEDNIIGNGFNNNLIYSAFYKNEILDNFNDNTIGDFGNLTNFEFYRNYIRDNFNDNIIRDDFQNNQIGTNFNNNTTNGEFSGNTILNDFNNNTIGDYFAVNNIGTNFNNNTVYDNFYYNSTDYYFYNNIISYESIQNNVGVFFQNNNPSNYTLFGWDDLSTVSTRNYELFFAAVNNDLNGKLLGKELVMKIISTSQYFKIKFTQWTQGDSGFQYERQEIDSNGNDIGNLIIFNKTNGGSEVDIIVEGVVEITRGDSNGIYNIATEGSWDSNVSPQDTEWNSIYTQTNNGQDFRDNKIGNNFEDNIIGNNFKDNIIGNNFEGNDITNDFQYNQIGSLFENNIIGDNFGFGGDTPQGNKIGNNFYNNGIGEYFYNNTIPDNFDNNIIGNHFQWNVVNTNINSTDFTLNYGNITGFTYTATGTSANDGIYTSLVGVTTSEFGVNATFDIEVSGGTVIGVSGNTEGKLYVTGDTITILGTEIGGYSKAIDTISDDGIGKGGLTGTYNDLSVTGGTGTNATFGVTVISDLVDSVIINNIGNGYEINDELILIGSLFGGIDGVDDITITVTALFDDDIVVTVSGVTIPSVYGTYTCQLFERQGGAKRLSFYDENDTLTITNIDE